MPTYDYQCTECGYSFEYFQAMSDDPLETCPECGGKVKRLIGGGLGVIFKGSGFYVTDNRKNNSAATHSKTKKENGATESTTSNNTSDSSAAKKTESAKPAKKEPAKTGS